MQEKMFSDRFADSKYKSIIFSDDLRDAVTHTTNSLIQLLGEVLTESGNEAEVQAATDLINALERYRDGYWYDDSVLPDSNDEESAELVE